MGKHVWTLLASLCLMSVKASFTYNQPLTTSEAPPLPSSTPEAIPLGMKEIVLYLTPDQVESLKEAGARVRPYPGYEAEFAQQEEYQKLYKKKYDPQNNQNYQPYSTNHAQKPDNELEEYYKAVNIQQINEDLSHEQQKPEPSTEKPYASTLRYKYTKSRQQLKEYFTPYLPKKPNRAKSNMEYVRWLPNWESENLKMEPFHAQPLSPYQWDWQLRDSSRTEPTLTAPGILETQKNPEVQEPDQLQGLVQVEPPVLTSWPSNENKRPDSLQESYKVQEENQEQVKTPEPTTAQPPIISDQEKLKSLLAPLFSHQNIVESIAQQREELVNNEQKIQTKLREIKEAPIHDQIKYAIEVDKLADNLGKQNTLSEIEAIAKSPDLEHDKFNLKQKRPPLSIVRHVEVPIPTATIVPITQPIEVKLPRPYAVPLEITQSTPAVKTVNVEVKRPTPVEVQKRVPVAVNRNVYVNIDKPYIVQKVVPVEVKQEIPVEVPVLKPEKLTIIRHIWEH